MATEHYIVDASTVPLKTIPMPDGHRLIAGVFLDGRDNGPEASSGSFSAGYVTQPHYHLGAQFQLILGGALEFPDVRLDAPAVHYTDHHVGYGPFTVHGEHDMFVLHAKPAGVVRMEDDRIAYLRGIDKSGREYVRSAHEVEWEPMPGLPGARRKILIPAADGPSVQIIECPPDMELASAVPAWGRFDVVHEGSIEIEGKTLGRRSLRFVGAGEPAPPLKAGPAGATMIVLEFDKNSSESYGGNNLQAIALAEGEIVRKRQA